MVAADQTTKTDACQSCGWEAFVTYDRQLDSAGHVRVLFPKSIRCTNPGCGHYGADSSAPDGQPLRRKADGRLVRRRLTRRQRRAFGRRDGEDALEFVARTHRTLRLRDLPGLLLIRNDDRGQVEAIQLRAQLKVAKWTRALTLSTLFLGTSVIVASLIVHS
jgi:hypothetical protein